MNSIVYNVATIQATFVSKETLKLIIDVLNNGLKKYKIY